MKTKILYLFLPLITLSVALLGSCAPSSIDTGQSAHSTTGQQTGAFRTPF